MKICSAVECRIDQKRVCKQGLVDFSKRQRGSKSDEEKERLKEGNGGRPKKRNPQIQKREELKMTAHVAACGDAFKYNKDEDINSRV